MALLLLCVLIDYKVNVNVIMYCVYVYGTYLSTYCHFLLFKELFPDLFYCGIESCAACA